MKRQPKSQKIIKKKRVNKDCLMPYGTYTKRWMSTLPAIYLHHLWTNGHLCERAQEGPVHDYIEANLDQLSRETPGKVWL